jgi:hypothetical protein
MKVAIFTVALVLLGVSPVLAQSTVRFFLYNPHTGTGIPGVEILLQDLSADPDSLAARCTTNSMGVGQILMMQGRYRALCRTGKGYYYVKPPDITVHEGRNLEVQMRLGRLVPFCPEPLEIKTIESDLQGAEQLETPEMNIVRAVTRKLIDEKIMLDTLMHLPTVLPRQPGYFTIPPEHYFDSVYQASQIVTWNDLKNTLLTALDSCHLPWSLGLFRCGNGIAMVAYPSSPNPVTGTRRVSGKVPGVRNPTWRDVLGLRPAQEPCVIFAFTDQSFELNGPADAWEQHREPVSGYDGTFRFDAATGMHYPRRISPCQVFVYGKDAAGRLDAAQFLQQTGLLKYLKGRL